jgi:hypothetical protein
VRPSLRFLGIAVVGWGTFRAATLDALPGAEIFGIDPSEAKPPPLIPTQFPPIEPLAAAPADAASAGLQAAGFSYLQAPPPAPQPRTVVVPVYYPPSAVSAGPTRLANALPEPRAQFFSPIPVLDKWPLSRIAATSMPPLQSRVVAPAQSLPAALKKSGIDRLQLTYNFNRQVSATLRSSSDVGRRGGEVAAGVRIQPVAGIPLWIDAERRQRIGRYGGGRSAFALFFEGGVYDRPMPMRFLLDAYLQGGVVGFHSRDRFIDGGLTLTRPVYKQFSAGLGVWGGAQPGLYRVDAGPRVTMQVRKNLRVHLDWRQRLAGNAQPGSGPAITLAGDF